jgi:stalled ribosome rescue protein Dom34
MIENQINTLNWEITLECVTTIMNKKNVKVSVGVCMDNASAVIISKNKDEESSEFVIQQTIKSSGDHSGGSEHSMNNAKQTGEVKYFKSVAAELIAFDDILIFGSGKAQEQFRNYLKEDTQFGNKQISIDSAGQLTDPQKIAMVRDFFSKQQ